MSTTDTLRELQRLGIIGSWVLPGMQIDFLPNHPDRRRIVDIGAGGRIWWATRDGESGRSDPDELDMWTLDTTDPLTAIGVLLLVREAWKDPTIAVLWHGEAWNVVRFSGLSQVLLVGEDFTTEAEALDAALWARLEVGRG